MKQFLLLPLCVLFFFEVTAQVNAPSPQYRLITGENFIQSKNYYLLTLLQQDPAVRTMIERDAELLNIAKARLDSLSAGLKNCKADAFCYTASMKFSEAEIAIVGKRLAEIYQRDNALGKLVNQQLIPSGTYILYNKLTPVEILVRAWEQDARGINYVIAVYGEGSKPNYPLIDSVTYNVKDARYSGLMYTTAYTVLNEIGTSKLFFVPGMTAALQLLEINERDNALDYEPMTSTVNELAYEKVRNINWKKFAYSVILVPGAGPEDPTVALSAEGMLRCRLAAVQYKKGLAPFIMVSGGKVHPYKTKFCEALEMKKFLIEKMQVPESAIIVEPHARHTTTNMRNCARLIFRYGIPFEKPCIAATSRGQSNMITNTLAARCQKELQEIPFRTGDRLSETESVFYPLIEALQINPMEPMDP